METRRHSMQSELLTRRASRLARRLRPVFHRENNSKTAGKKSGDNSVITEILPRDLILCVADFLSPVDLAAWALTNKWTLSIIGMQSLVLPRRSEERRELLLRLERDWQDASCFFCIRCVALHPPELSWTIAADERYRGAFGESRPCLQRYSKSRPEWQPSPWLPRRLDFEKVKTAMIRYRLGDLGEPKDLLPKDTIWHPHPSGLDVHHETKFLISKGKMLLWTCTKLSPYLNLKRRQVDLSQFLELLGKSADLSHCCAHATWQRKYPFIFNPGIIETPESENFKAKLWRSAQQEKYYSKIETCDFCYTSYHYGIYNSGHTVALISYKDLGEGESTADPRWKSHQWHESENALPTIERQRLGTSWGWGWAKKRLHFKSDLQRAKK